MADQAIAYRHAAAAADVAQRAKAVPAIQHLARNRTVPGNQRKRRQEPAWTDRWCAAEQRVRRDAGGGVGPGRYDPVIARHTVAAELNGQPGFAKRHRTGQINCMINCTTGIAASGPDPAKEIGFLSRCRIIQRVNRRLPIGRVEPVVPFLRHLGSDKDGVVNRIIPRFDLQQQPGRFGHFFTIVQQHAPAHDLDRHTGKRPAEFIARRGQKPQFAPRVIGGMRGHLYPVHRRGIVSAPDEPTRLCDLNAEGFIARAQKPSLGGGAAQIVQRIKLGEPDRHARLRQDLAACGIQRAAGKLS